MDLKQLQAYLDAPETAKEWMDAIGITHAAGGMRNMKSIASHDPTLEFMGDFVDVVSPLIRWSADPDMVLNSLERFFQASRSPRTLFSLFLQDKVSLSTLLDIFATSQYLGDMLINEPELFETVRQSDGQPQSQRQLTDELVDEIMGLEKDEYVLRAIRRFKRRQTLRIAYGDIIKKQPLEIVTRQISRVAEATIEAAIRAAGRKLFHKRGTPRSSEGAMAHFTVLALGKLGGRELNYSSDIDLMFLYDREGYTDPEQERIDNSQYFAEMGREIVRFLSEQTELGAAYRVDMRLRPNGKHGSLAIGLDEALRYYDNRGRTWERQAFIKARPVAGNIQLGNDFLKRLEPWIYRRNLLQADIAGIRTLKRRIERNAIEAGDALLNVKTGYGGIRDIEFMAQFLQLLHGGDLPELRTGNTLTAIERLERTGCITPLERDLLSEDYRFLRKIEHRLQIMFDLQTHVMPEAPEETRKLALRMGYNDMSWQRAEEAFKADFQYITTANRGMLNHLLVNAFQDNEVTAAEVDLLLDTQPEPERIRPVLEKYGFEDVDKAYRLLCDLMDEKNPYLSARRCRHFLVAIAPELLKEIAKTPQPDQTLTTLDAVADDLGAKGGLWELFSYNQPSLALFVRLCAFAPFLTDMLRADPGMLDGLMDSLVLDRIPPREILDDVLTKLCVNAEQPEPILAGFKHDRLLPIGVRDLLGRSPVRDTSAAISDVAQVCLKQIIYAECRNLIRRYGTPAMDSPTQSGDCLHPETKSSLPPEDLFSPCRFAILGLGKFGGRVMNYHGDLDILPLFEGDGETRPFCRNAEGRFSPMPHDVETIPNQVFFNKLVQALVKRLSGFGPWGKLYEIDLRLRPMGKSGSLATSLDAFNRYFTEGTGELWERQMLCKARIVGGSDMFCPNKDFFEFRHFSQIVMRAVRSVQYCKPFDDDATRQIRAMRKRRLDLSGEDQLKRTPGGTLDVEFIVQMLQLKFGSEKPGIVVPNTFDALEKLYAAELIAETDFKLLAEGYVFLRSLASFLCLLNDSTAKRIPTDEHVKAKLARLAGFDSAVQLVHKLDKVRYDISACFDRFFPE